MRKLFISKALAMLMALALTGAVTAHAQDYDVVLKGGRVMDPETRRGYRCHATDPGQLHILPHSRRPSAGT
jgi:hypothetical protein